jgi:hypothetical protein
MKRLEDEYKKKNKRKRNKKKNKKGADEEELTSNPKIMEMEDSSVKANISENSEGGKDNIMSSKSTNDVPLVRVISEDNEEVSEFQSFPNLSGLQSMPPPSPMRTKEEENLDELDDFKLDGDA